MELDRGVKRFVIGRATVEVKFPVDWNDKLHIRCDLCPFVSISSNICRLTGDPVFWPHKTIGYDCPLNFEENKEE